jgi:hypothetical protein
MSVSSVIKSIPDSFSTPASVSDAINTMNESVNGLIKSNTENPGVSAHLLRKIFSTSIKVLSCAFAGVVGYAIYRSYMTQNKGDLDSENYFNEEQFKLKFSNPKRKKEDVEEVNLYLYIFE